jgi:hypothetical protein
MDLLIAADNGQLYAKLGNNPAFEIYPRFPLEFYGNKVNIKFTFQSDEEGSIIGLIANGRGKLLPLIKSRYE